jgi:hypothetical protein
MAFNLKNFAPCKTNWKGKCLEVFKKALGILETSNHGNVVGHQNVTTGISPSLTFIKA